MSERFAEQHGAQGGRTTGVNRCASSGTERQGQLATIREVLELLRNGGADFTDLEPIRTRYRQQFGDERCQVCMSAIMAIWALCSCPYKRAHSVCRMTLLPAI